jgi:hypothetical protein
MARVNANDHSRRLVRIGSIGVLMTPGVGCWMRNETEAGRGQRLIFLQAEGDANDVGGVRLERDGAAVVIEDERRLSNRPDRVQSKRETNHK